LGDDELGFCAALDRLDEVHENSTWPEDKAVRVFLLERRRG
jgi:hypothetical protein